MLQVQYRPVGADLLTDDYRPYVVTLHGKDYRFPDKWQARDFASQTESEHEIDQLTSWLS